MCSAAKDGTCKVWDVTYTGRINLNKNNSTDSADAAEGTFNPCNNKSISLSPEVFVSENVNLFVSLHH